MFWHSFSVLALVLGAFTFSAFDANAGDDFTNVLTKVNKKSDGKKTKGKKVNKKVNKKTSTGNRKVTKRTSNAARRQVAGARVQRILAKTDEILSQAQAVVLEKGAGEEEYREAVVAQTAAQQQLASQKAKIALTLTMQARKHAEAAKTIAQNAVVNAPTDPAGPAVVPIEVVDNPPAAPVAGADNPPAVPVAVVDNPPAAPEVKPDAPAPSIAVAVAKGDVDDADLANSDVITNAVFNSKVDDDQELIDIAAVLENDEDVENEALAALEAAQALVPDATSAAKKTVVATPEAPVDPAKTAAELAAEAESYED